MKYLAGWGRVNCVENPKIVLAEDLSPQKRLSKSILAIGNFRSYGDSALNTHGLHVDTSNLRQIDIDPLTGIAICGSGVKIGELEKAALLKGYFPPVVPGTGEVTLGGAFASDIHGKSHHVTGSFGVSVLSIVLVDGQGRRRNISHAGDTSDLFYATMGGMGLTGLIESLSIQLKKVETSYVLEKQVRVHNLSEMIEKIREFDENYLYTVAWIDLSPPFQGRGIVSGANHAELKDLNNRLQKNPYRFKLKRNASLPNFYYPNLVNRINTKIFNWVWFHKPLGGGISKIYKFMHPLDGLTNWNLLYGKHGFVQYQFTVPFHSEKTLGEVLFLLKKYKANSPMGVLKIFGQASPGLLSFPREGWTLALDFSSRLPNLDRLISELNTIITKNNGRVYLAKDSFLNSEIFFEMYTNIDEWKQVKLKYDAKNVWQSDQGRRLNLC
jgi:decaprenylphospho-beta-D-ribofuranose 2-oxidase